MIHIWKGHFTRAEGDPARCRHAVPDGGRSPGFHQCSRKPVVFREVDQPPWVGRFGFCKQHDPVQVDLRQRAKEHAWGEQNRRQQEGWQRAKDIAEAKERCVAALREIEAGHNDPRAVARTALHQLDALK